MLAVLLMSAKAGVPVCPHAGGVGLCEYVVCLTSSLHVARRPERKWLEQTALIGGRSTCLSSTTSAFLPTWSEMCWSLSTTCTSTSCTPSPSTTRVDMCKLRSRLGPVPSYLPEKRPLHVLNAELRADMLCLAFPKTPRAATLSRCTTNPKPTTLSPADPTGKRPRPATPLPLNTELLDKPLPAPAHNLLAPSPFMSRNKTQSSRYRGLRCIFSLLHL